MALSDTWLLKKIFGNRSDEYEVDPDFQEYFRELSTLSGDRLAQEPERLNEERVSLQEETENLAYSNYKTFIQAANCSKEIYDDFTLINKNVDTLLDSVPNVSGKCEQFLAEARKINGRRTGNSLALQKNTQILEILEIPQVMDTCVRAGYYEEALELAQYATKLERRLSHIPLIKSIASEVARQRELLLENLLEQLRTSLTLSHCLKVVGYCRRLNVFSEAELRTEFLLARNSWFDNLLAAVPRDDPYHHITKIMELSRVHLFDIITHYRAAFPDEDAVHSSLISRSIGDDSSSLNAAEIFHSWLFDKVNSFLDFLRTDLATLAHTQNVSRMDSIMAQCMYFGLSFGRAGADFRTLAAPIFENAAWTFYETNVDRAYERLAHELRKFRAKDIVSTAPKTHSVHLPTAEGDFAVGTGSTSVHPPNSLLQCPPLARFCNSILSIFNELRTCFPLSLAVRVSEKLESCAVDLARVIAIIQKDFDGKEVGSLLASLLINDFVPYMNICLECLFPAKQLASALGFNMADFSQLQNLGRIDPSQIGTILQMDAQVKIPDPSVPTENSNDNAGNTL